MRTTVSLSLAELLEIRSSLRRSGEDGAFDDEDVSAAVERLERKIERAIKRAKREGSSA